MNCKGCPKRLRKSHQTAANYPGTVRHAGYGYCYPCRKQLREDGVDLENTDSFDVNFLRTCDRLWIADRRRRLGQQ